MTTKNNTSLDGRESEKGSIDTGVWIGMGAAIFISVVGVLIACLAMRERRRHRLLRRPATDIESKDKASWCPILRGNTQSCTSAIPMGVISPEPASSPPLLRYSRDTTVPILSIRDSVATDASGPYARIKSMDLTVLDEELKALMRDSSNGFPEDFAPIRETPQVRPVNRTPTPISQRVCFLHGEENCLRESCSPGPESPYDVPKSITANGYPTFPRVSSHQRSRIDMFLRPLPDPPLPPKNHTSPPRIGPLQRSRTFHGRGVKDRKPSIPPKPKVKPSPRCRSSSETNSGTYLDMGLLPSTISKSGDAQLRSRPGDVARRADNSMDGQPERNHSIHGEENASPTLGNQGGEGAGRGFAEQAAGTGFKNVPENCHSPRRGGNAVSRGESENGDKDELHCYENVKQAIPTALARSPKLNSRAARSPSPRVARTPYHREDPPRSPSSRRELPAAASPLRERGQSTLTPSSRQSDKPPSRPFFKQADLLPLQQRVGAGKIIPEGLSSPASTNQDGDEIQGMIRPPGTRGRQPRRFKLSGDNDFLRSSSSRTIINEAEKRRLRMLGLDADNNSTRQTANENPPIPGQAKPVGKGPPPPVPHKPRYRPYVNVDTAQQWATPSRVKSSEQLLPSPLIARPLTILNSCNNRRLSTRVSLRCRLSKAASDGDKMEEEVRLLIQQELEQEEDLQALKKDMLNVLQNSYFFTDVSDYSQNAALFSEDDDSCDSTLDIDLFGGRPVRRQRSFVTRLSQEPISACILTRNRSASLPAIRTTELSIPTNFIETHI